MAETRPYTVSRVPVLPEPWVMPGHDYADRFELRLAHPSCCGAGRPRRRR